jgi:hypothetical protein
LWQQCRVVLVFDYLGEFKAIFEVDLGLEFEDHIEPLKGKS